MEQNPTSVCELFIHRFTRYRIRALLYAGRPTWALLATVTPR